MKNYKHKDKGSIFSLLMNSYIFFTAIIVISALAISSISNYLLYGKYDATLGMVDKYTKYLKEEKYNKLDLKEIAGTNGSLEILDENYNIIYSLGKKINLKSYDEDIIKYIPDYENNDEYLNVYDYNDGNGESYQVILAESYDYYGIGANKWFKVLDSNLNVILKSSNAPIDKNTYTAEEIRYMSGSYNEEFFLEKYEYVNNEGLPRIAIIKSVDIYNVSFLKKIDNFTKYSLGIFGLAYILCMILFAIGLRRKFYEPLAKLKNAMQHLIEGKREDSIRYEGPKEFVDICDSFNVMVNKVESSEKERKKLMEEKQRMIADIAHDLKTPITSIQGYSKALVDGIIEEKDRDKYINIIYKKSEKLTELINIFHEYSKLEHPNFNLHLVKVDLCEYLRAYIALKYEDIIECGFNIEVDLPEEEMYTQIDEIQFQRVLDNILGNSIKHNPQGTDIFVSLKTQHNNYEITIADNGIGIPAEIVENIFEPFTVGDDSRNSKQGSGLGLAIVKTIVELHGGTIKLVSKNHGKYNTEFKIKLAKEFNKIL